MALDTRFPAGMTICYGYFIYYFIYLGIHLTGVITTCTVVLQKVTLNSLIKINYFFDKNQNTTIYSYYTSQGDTQVYLLRVT